MLRAITITISFALGLAVTAQIARLAEAAPPIDCSTPRNAARTLLEWQQPGSYSPEKASRCLATGVRPPAELARLAEQLKAVYDARGLYVVLEELPDDPAAAGEGGRVFPHPDVRDVWLERHPNGEWLFPDPVLVRVPGLYDETYSGLIDRLIARMPRSLKGTVFGVQLWQYLALLLLISFSLVVRKVIQYFAANRVKHLADRFGARWGGKFVHAIDSPGATLVMAGVLSATYPQLHLPIHAVRALAFSVRLLATLSVVWAAYRLVDVVSEALAHRAAKTDSKLDDQLVPLLRRSLKVVTVVVGALFVLQNLDVDVGSLLAGLGIGGLAVALAAKDTLSNLFGSLMIFTDRPFQVGDWVVVDKTEGIVEEVGFRSTRVRTFYNSLVTVPNSRIAEATIDNYGARRYRRTYVTINLTYDTTPEQMQAFVEGVRAIINANEFTRKDYYEVHFSGFGAHSLDVMLYFFFEVKSWSVELRERHNVFLEVLRLARQLGVSFAFPTQTLLHEMVAEVGAPRIVAPALPPDRLAEIVNSFGPQGSLARPAHPRIAGGWYAGSPPPKREMLERATDGAQGGT